MIQRQQSLWLVLSIVSAFLSFKLPFYTGTKIADTLPKPAHLDGGSNFFLVVFTAAALILAGITVFMYKNRKLQLKLCYGGIGLSALLLIIYFTQIRKFQTGSVSLSCLFVFAILAGFIMAARGVWHDEKLVKTLDKLR